MDFDSKKYYRKAIKNLILEPLKEYGFKKYKTSHIAKISDGEILQLINFQKSSTGGQRFTVNISVRPLYIKHEGLTLEPGGRLGKFYTGGDIWWQYKTEEGAERSFNEIQKIIIEKVIPWFELNSSTQNIFNYQHHYKPKKFQFKLKPRKNKHRPEWKPRDFGFVALRLMLYKIAKQNFEVVLDDLSEMQNIDWCKDETTLLSKITKLINEENHTEIKSMLDDNIKESFKNLNLNKIQ
jgi:hypothetical protein